MDFNKQKLYNGHQKWVPSLATMTYNNRCKFAKFQQIITDYILLTLRHIAELIVHTVLDKHFIVKKFNTQRSPYILKNE